MTLPLTGPTHHLGPTLKKVTVTLIGRPALGINALALPAIRLIEDLNAPGPIRCPYHLRRCRRLGIGPPCGRG
jgi:hypothetical protein